jgi:hypothetical protein
MLIDPSPAQRAPPSPETGQLLLLSNETGFKTLYLLSRPAFDGVVYGDGKSATRYYLVTSRGGTREVEAPGCESGGRGGAGEAGRRRSDSQYRAFVKVRRKISSKTKDQQACHRCVADCESSPSTGRMTGMTNAWVVRTKVVKIYGVRSAEARSIFCDQSAV